MFAKKCPETNISVKLDELLTTDSCLTIIMELLKHLLYRKRQVPYDWRTLQLRNINHNDKTISSLNNLFELLQNVSENLSAQFQLEESDIQEIIISIGATIVSPRICIRLKLPSRILSSEKHKETQHPPRKPLLNLMKSMFECMEFQDALDPLEPTNTFILLQKSDSSKKSEYFIPKPDYALPTRTKSFCIKLTYGEEIAQNCSCNGVVIHNDFSSANKETCKVSGVEQTEHHAVPIETSYQWYQSREVIRGFK